MYTTLRRGVIKRLKSFGVSGVSNRFDELEGSAIVHPSSCWIIVPLP